MRQQGVQITIEGELAHSWLEIDGTRTYTVTFSEAPTMTPERLECYVIDLVKAATGAGEWIIDRHRGPRESTWQPYVCEVTQVNSTLWKVTIVYGFLDLPSQEPSATSLATQP